MTVAHWLVSMLALPTLMLVVGRWFTHPYGNTRPYVDLALLPIGGLFVLGGLTMLAGGGA